MEQNNFEKHLQHKMEELKMPPSEAVWTHIEKQIGKKKNDRKTGWFVLFLFLLLFSGGFWWLHREGQSVLPSGSLQSVPQPGNGKSLPQEGAGDIALGRVKGKPAGSAQANKVAPATGRALSASGLPSGGNRPDRRWAPKGRPAGGILQSDSKASPWGQGNSKDKMMQGQSQARVLHPPTDSVTQFTSRSEMDLPGAPLKSPVLPIPGIQTDPHGDRLQVLTAGGVQDQQFSKVDPGAKKHTGSRHIEQWSLGARFSGGISLLGQLPMGIRNSNPLPQSDYNGAPSGNFPPGKIGDAAAFTAGIFVEKKISSGKILSFGLSYKYFSLAGRIGSKIDSAASNYQNLSSSGPVYSAASNVNTYRNDFHYVDLPVSLKFQLGHSGKLPWYVLAGFNFSQLVSSNALQYQPNPGIYYTNNKLMNKSQFGLHTGFAMTLFPKQKIPLSVGPYFYYSVTRIADVGRYQGKHFSFIGLQAEFVFKKNNR